MPDSTPFNFSFQGFLHKVYTSLFLLACDPQGKDGMISESSDNLDWFLKGNIKENFLKSWLEQLELAYFLTILYSLGGIED